MPRDLIEIRNEADYWKALLDDLQAISQQLVALAEPLPMVPVQLLTAFIALPDGSPAVEALDGIRQANSETMNSILEIIRAVGGMIDLALGRCTALEREFEGQT